uniref:Uncharacterized protein n=1 Tax=Trypanosoma congolense (strain IL3000) TaxID=1068625 RepID=F9W460_TRYCI|nr:hypothetical protein, unlikely [Trypanosoma congolense IL3000]
MPQFAGVVGTLSWCDLVLRHMGLQAHADLLMCGSLHLGGFVRPMVWHEFCPTLGVCVLLGVGCVTCSSFTSGKSLCMCMPFLFLHIIVTRCAIHERDRWMRVAWSTVDCEKWVKASYDSYKRWLRASFTKG